VAKPRAIIKRRKAVENIRKITRTMQLIATARFQQALKRATAAKPYTARITELVEDLAGSTESFEHPLLQRRSTAGRSALLVITSNRGLCGGYNGQIMRTALDYLERQDAAGQDVELHVIGKKGIGYFRFLNRPLTSAVTEIEDRPTFADAERLAEEFMDQFQAGRVDAVHVVYMRFISAGLQRPSLLQLLPMADLGGRQDRAEHAEDAEIGAAKPKPIVPPEYEFSPPAERLLTHLLPQAVKTRLYQCLIDAAVSEQVSRMVAMKAATEAAEEMIKHLTQQYNRSRQTQITLELLDIVGGSEAIK